jgi:hypothetical protein
MSENIDIFYNKMQGGTQHGNETFITVQILFHLLYKHGMVCIKIYVAYEFCCFANTF